jgi:hypothetical protein
VLNIVNKKNKNKKIPPLNMVPTFLPWKIAGLPDIEPQLQ